MSVETAIPLAGGNARFGLVTRLIITLRELGAPTSRTIGSAQVALIESEQAQRQGERIHHVLHQDSSELLALYPALFFRGMLKKQYGNDQRRDVIYVEALELHSEWRGRQIEEAIILKVFSTWGWKCAVGVVDMSTLPEPARWRAVGFQLVETAKTPFLVLDLCWSSPFAVEEPGRPDTFRIADPEDGLDDEDEDDEDDEDEVELDGEDKDEGHELDEDDEDDDELDEDDEDEADEVELDDGDPLRRVTH